ncbi:MAG TPA: RluA family pseudouridine synthase [Thermoanaerobaculia bacterium]|nr:RluA family pseudouridine synthase [Thermoanaerobaculia bacterium]
MPPEAAGERLDRHVAARLERPRNQVRRWIEAGLVRVGGAPAKPASMLAAGDRVECAPPAPVDDRIVPEAAPLALLHEDAWLLVLDKPPGLAVHPGAGRPSGTLAHRLLARDPEMAGVGGPGRPGIVHRLDKDTSGALVVARTAAAYERLARAFAAREVEKRYLAIAYGAPRPAAGRIEAPIGRHPLRRKEMTVRRDGRPATTGYRTLAAAAGIALLELDLATGRTHQIRVHLKHLGHPLVGDPVYGEARWKGLPAAARGALERFPRPALHAWRLAFRHPATGERAAFEAPVPEDLKRLWEEVTGSALPALPRGATAAL